jgi:hypothetical protein
MTAPWKLPPDLVAEGLTVPANIVEAIEHPRWWGEWFKRGDWRPWRAALASMFALPLDEEALAIFQKHTGRTEPPIEQVREAWYVCGRRAGKTRVMSTVAAWVACFLDWRPFLAPGERATIMILASDRAQARVAMRYLRSLITQHPLLKQLVEREGRERIELTCGTILEVASAGFRGTRGYSLAAVLADEVSFWRSEEDSANPAEAIFEALRPSMATLPGSLMMIATTPYSKRGIVFDTYKRHWAKNGDPILIWNATTRQMNASVPQAVVDEAYELDPQSAAAEFGGEFRGDVQNWITREILEACTIAGRHELPPVTRVSYVAFADPAGGSGGDSFTLAIAYRDRVSGNLVLACTREVMSPFNPSDAVWELATTLRQYGITHIKSDRYAALWPVEAFKKAGIICEQSEFTKSEIYSECLPLLNSHRIELLDDKRLRAQFLSLERRTARSGKDSIDHTPGSRDDLCNAAAGALVLAQGSGTLRITPELLAAVAKAVPRHVMRERMLSRL